MAKDDPDWWALMDGLDRSGRLAKPSAEWQLDIMAAVGHPAVIDLM